MRYSEEIIINLPRDKVVSLFDNASNMYKWMPGLKSFEHISGTAGEPGAKSKLTFDMNGRVIEMIETITHKNLPDELSGNYDAKGVHNKVNNKFESIDDTQTKWILDTEFQFSGMMKVMGLFMKSAFPKQTRKNMQNFKDFVENNKEK